MIQVDTRAWPRRRVEPSKADLRYAQIYETAARLFYEKGYASTSLQDLASEVGLQKGSLYHYISSKEDLLFGITEYAHEFFVDLIDRAQREDLPPLARLEQTLRVHAEFAAERFHVTAAFYNDRSAMSTERRNRIIATRDAYENMLRRFVRDGQQQGEIPPDLDPKLAVLGILGMINWMHQWYNPAGSLTPQEISVDLARMAVRALLPPPNTSRTESSADEQSDRLAET